MNETEPCTFCEAECNGCPFGENCAGCRKTGGSPFGGRCCGVVSDGSFLLVCRYGEGGSSPELLLCKAI